MIIQEKFDEFPIDRPSNSRDVFRLQLRSLATLDEQRQPLCYADRLHADACESAARVQSLEYQVMAHPAELASACGDMTRLKEPVEAAQR